MKIWIKTIVAHKMQDQAVQEFASARPSDSDGWVRIMTELVKPLDVAVPVILKKHVNELTSFSRTVFRRQDFMESIPFDALEIEIFPEKKKDARVTYSFGED